jgi:hypothetical protein
MYTLEVHGYKLVPIHYTLEDVVRYSCDIENAGGTTRHTDLSVDPPHVGQIENLVDDGLVLQEDVLRGDRLIRSIYTPMCDVIA